MLTLVDSMTHETQFDIRQDSFPSDAELRALFTTSWPDTNTARFQKTLRACLTHFTAHSGTRLVGFAKLATDGADHAFLLDPTVHPDFRRSGLGTLLVRRTIDAANEQGIHHVHVDFEPHLKDFYENCGFKPTAAGLISF